MKKRLAVICIIATVLLASVFSVSLLNRRSALNQALYEAVDQTDASAVRKLLKQGADPNARRDPISSKLNQWERLTVNLSGQRTDDLTVLVRAEQAQLVHRLMLKNIRPQYESKYEKRHQQADEIVLLLKQAGAMN
jgi:hypothetical protein